MSLYGYISFVHSNTSRRGKRINIQNESCILFNYIFHELVTDDTFIYEFHLHANDYPNKIIQIHLMQ